MNGRMSIRDVMLEAISKGMSESDALVYCRARIHIPKVSNKRLREYYELTKATKPNENHNNHHS